MINNIVPRHPQCRVTQDSRGRKFAFTYIELLITLAFIGIIFIPVMQLFSHSLYSLTVSRDLITATNLAKWQMERIKNRNFSKSQWIEKGNQVYPPMEDEPLYINDAYWRIYTEVGSREALLEMRVNVHKEGEPEPTFTLVTLIEDTLWEVIQPSS